METRARWVLDIIEEGLALLLAEKLRAEMIGEAVDYTRDKFLEEYVLPVNAKHYPLSGLQHFVGAGILAAHLAAVAGLNDRSVATAYLAGLVHDYEKAGVGFARLSDDEKVSLLCDHLESIGLGDYADDESICHDALHAARTLESGGTRLKLQRIAELVRLADYVTGGLNAWSVTVVADMLRRPQDHGVNTKGVDVVEIVLGKQRPITAFVAPSLVEHLESMGAEPLVLTPTGIVVSAPKNGRGLGGLEQAYWSIAKRLTGEYVEAFSGGGGGSKDRTAPSLEYLVNHGKRLVDSVKSKGGVPGALLGKSVKLGISQYSVSELREFYEGLNPADKLYFVVSFAVHVAKDYSKADVKKSVPHIATELGVEATSASTFVKEVYKLAEINIDSVFNKLLEVVEKIAAKERSWAKEIEEVVYNELCRSITAPGMKPSEAVVGGNVVTCSICRSKTGKSVTRKLKEYIDVLQSVDRNVGQEVFHPDVPGDLSRKVTEDLKNLYICPVCLLEAQLLPRKMGVYEGFWAAVLLYYPNIPYRLARAVKKAVEEVRDVVRAVIVLPDYTAAKIIVNPADGLEKELSRKFIENTLALWYVVGGNVVLTMNPLNLPSIEYREPIIVEKSDWVFDIVVDHYLERLRKAAEASDYLRQRVHRLRLETYKLLRTYVKSLEESTAAGRVRLLKSMRMPVFSPALSVYSMYVSRQFELKRR